VLVLLLLLRGVSGWESIAQALQIRFFTARLFLLKSILSTIRHLHARSAARLVSRRCWRGRWLAITQPSSAGEIRAMGAELAEFVGIV
jgi:hypothetical protein